jgi:hypothetical protein
MDLKEAVADAKGRSVKRLPRIRRWRARQRIPATGSANAHPGLKMQSKPKNPTTAACQAGDREAAAEAPSPAGSSGEPYVPSSAMQEAKRRR